MTTQYTPILALALPVTGELSGTWGDVVNDNITSMVEQAIAGLATINTWSGNGHTLTTADGLSAESRCAMLVLTDTGTALTGAATVICPTASKIYIVKNTSGQSATITTAAGTGIAVPNGETMFVFCDGTNVVQAVTRIASADVDFAKLKGTGAVVVTNILDEDNMASDSATALATQQSIKAYVDSQISANNDLSEVLANGNTTGGTDIAVSAGDDITFTATSNAIFADNGKAIFGAGSDLQIYHDGTTSKIDGNLSVTNALTLSAGTANGVTYLNGSKVLTSGSALTFDGTTFGVNNGVAGGAALSLTGTYSGAGSVAFLNFQRVGGAVAGTLGYNDANNSIQFGTTTNHSTIFLQNNAEAMRLTSTGLGIGTSSPAVKLDITGYETRLLAPSSGKSISIYADSAGSVIGYLSSGYLSFGKTTSTVSTQYTEQLRLDSAGNLGLGVTPSAWGSQYKAVQNVQASLASASSYGWYGLLFNAYSDNTDFIYQAGNRAGEYRFDVINGTHAWYNAPSGTAGDAISFTQAMTLHASGGLSLGNTTDPGAGTLTIGAATSRLVVQSTTGTNNALVKFMNTGGDAYIGLDNSGGGLGAAYGLNLYHEGSYPIVFSTANTERARITSAGNVGIGTTSPSAKLSILNTSATYSLSQNIFNASAGNFWIGQAPAATYFSVDNFAMAFCTGSDGGVAGTSVPTNERMRIDSAGNVGIGTSSPAVRLSFGSQFTGNNGYANAIRLYDNGEVSTSTTSNSYGFGYTQNSLLSYTAGTGGDHVFYGANTERLRITSAGNVGIGTSSPNRQIELSTFIAGAPTGSGFVGGALRLSNLTEYEANYAAGGGNPDFLGSIEFYSGDTSAGAGVRTAIKTSVDAYYNANSLCFYTAPSSTAGILERLRIDSAGNVGIGGSIDNHGGYGRCLQISGIEAALELESSSGYSYVAQNGVDLQIRNVANGVIPFYTNSTERMRIDSAGSLLVNTTAGYGKFTVASTAGTGKVILDNYASVPTTENVMSIYADASRGYIQSYNNGYKDIAICPSGGGLVVGTTSNSRGARLRVEGLETAHFTGYGNGYGIGLWMTPNPSATGGTATPVSFQNVSDATVGSITTTASATAYNTSSDYRLKEDWVAVADASTRVNALKPVNFAWKVNGSRVDGFLAHELAEVVPEAITGAKDAVDAEGKPVYQGIDQSKLVPLLTAALQEALAKIESLTARVSALEGN
jgi:hypothetical protein